MERYRKRSFEEKVAALAIDLKPDEYRVIARLNNPLKVQEWLDEIPYNDDYRLDKRKDTTFSPLLVLRHKKAHCFEGALFSYMVNWLHGWKPKIVLLEGLEDEDHNICIWKDPHSSLYGANSKGDKLSAREPKYETLTDLVKSYDTWYGYPEELTVFNVAFRDEPNSHFSVRFCALSGHSQEIDLVTKYGTCWMGERRNLWDIYYTYIDSKVKFYDPLNFGGVHMYPFIRALKEGWIKMDQSGMGCIDEKKLPEQARLILKIMDEDRRRGKLSDGLLLLGFFQSTHTTPNALTKLAEIELPEYIKSGFKVD